MTTRNGLGEVSDHSRSMAITAGSTLSATAGPPAISNATSTSAKRRTTTSPDESPKRIYKAADSPQGATGRRKALRGILWGSVTYLPVSSTRKCGQLRDDGNNSVFCACWVRDGPEEDPHAGPQVPRCQRTFRSLARVAGAGSFWSSRHVG